MTDPLLDGLNPEQREAVTLPDQNALDPERPGF